MNIKELLEKLQEMDAELFAELNESASESLKELRAQAKLELLNEIVDMMPDIKDRLRILDRRQLDPDYYFGGNTPAEILEKLEQWENN